MKVCITGDSLLMNSLPKGYAGFDAVSDLIGKADVKISNLETTVTEHDCYASTYCGTPWMTIPRYVFDDICRFGFNCFTFANNHTMDYSYDGMFSTLAALKERNMPVAGAGASLSEATEPAIIRTDNGSVAVLSISATSNDAGRAGDPGHKIPARPGLNMLRHSETFLVNRAHMDALQEIARTTKINGRRDLSRKGGYIPEKPGIFSLGDLDFKLSDTEGKISAPNRRDMERMRKAIEKAREDADHVIVCFHSHEIKGLVDDEPDYFIETFARSCIEWGADAVLGSGTHEIKAVEIYQGKPIFYSIANFIFQMVPQELPADFYEKYGIPAEKTAAEAMDQLHQHGTRGLTVESRYYKSLMPMLEFDGDRLVKIRIQPLELGFYLEDERCKGLPCLADGAAAQDIYDILCERSKTYGTKLTLTENCIEVDLT